MVVISTGQSIFEDPCLSLDRELFLLLIHSCSTALVDDASSIADLDVFLLDAVNGHELDAGNTSSTCSVQHDLCGSNLSTCDFERIDEASKADDSSPVLVVVEDRDVHERLQLFLYVEAVRRLDVFEIDSTEGWSEQFDAVDKLFRILSVDAVINGFDTGELVEKYSFTFHHGLGSE